MGGGAFGALPVDPGAFGVSVEGVHAGFDGEEEGVGGDEVVGAAIEVAVVAGDGLVEKTGFVGGKFFDPQHEE